MATIIDAFLVTLGLDNSNFIRGSKATQTQVSALTKQTRELGTVSDKATDAFANGIRQVRLQLLALYSVVSAGRGFKQMIGDVISGDRELGQFAQSIGDTTERVAQWSGAVTRAGGTAQGFRQTLATIRSALSSSVIDGFSDQINRFNRLGIETVDRRTRQALTPEQILTNTRRVLQQRNVARPIAEEYFRGIIDSGTMASLYKPQAEFDGYLRDQQRMGTANDDDAARAQKIVNALNDTKQILEQLVRGLVREFGDDIVAGLTKLNKWLTEHREDIIKFFREWEKAVKNFDWQGLLNNLSEFAKAVDRVADAMGGWLRITELLFTAWAVARVARLVAGIAGVGAALGGRAVAAGVGGRAAAGLGLGGAARLALGGVGTMLMAGGIGDWIAAHGTPAGQEYMNRPGVTWFRNLLNFRPNPITTGSSTSAAPGRNIMDQVRIDSPEQTAQSTNYRWGRLGGSSDGSFPTYNGQSFQQQRVLDYLRRSAEGAEHLIARFNEWRQTAGVQTFGNTLAQVTNDMGIGGGPATVRGGNVNPSQAARESFRWWVNRGMTPAAAAGIVANEMRESVGNPNARGDKVNGQYTAGGLYQWHKPRRDRILAATGIDVWNATADQQRQAFYLEGQLGLDPQWGRGFRLLNGITDPRQAGAIVSLSGERPLLAESEAMGRGNDAAGYMRLYNSGFQAGPPQPFMGPQSLRVANQPAMVNAGTGGSGQTEINFGDINIFSNAKDGHGLGRDFKSEVSRSLASQANTGLR